MIAGVAAAMFIGWELQRREPMLDIRLFRHHGFSAGSMTLAALFFAMAGTVFLQAQYLQFILGYTPLAAGFALVPAALGMLVGTGAGAHLSSALSGRIVVVTGTVLAATGLAVQAGFAGGTSYLPTGIGLFLFGLGAGVAMPTATDLIMATLPPARAGIGSAVNDTVRELGGALGVAVIGSIAASRYAADVGDSLDRLGDVPTGVRTAITNNVGAALDVSHQLGVHGTDIATAARDAFVGSMSSSLWVGVGFAALATLTAYRHLPKAAPGAGHHRHSRGHGGHGFSPPPASDVVDHGVLHPLGSHS